MTINLPFSQACENNKAPILERLSELFAAPGTVLELGTGTGQHAVHFARALPHLQWQPSDHPDAVDTCRARLAQARLPNLLTPVGLDVSARPWPVESFSGVFSANTAHIMGWRDVEQMFHQTGQGLREGGVFCLYGPFNNQGRFSSDSNRQFDQHLRARSCTMGIRDLEDLTLLAQAAGLTLCDNHAMPANNRLLVFRQAPPGGQS